MHESPRVKHIDTLIINSPYEEPQAFWRYNREDRTFTQVSGARRPAGYIVATPGSQAHDDPGVFHLLPLVNQIRERVKAWRDASPLRWPGVSGVTRRLLEHWYSADERRIDRQFFFCQLEAIETLIWLTEASPAERQGIVIPGDGGPFARVCAKMATGSGKTIVMAMVIAWHVLNKVLDPQNSLFSKNVLIIAPGLTVKNRLQVLQPAGEGNYYEEFDIVPSGLMEKLRLGRVAIQNWHRLEWETDKELARKKGVDKRGAKSDERYVRDVLGEMASARRLLVINDEAHHAWRAPVGKRVAGVSRADVDEATKWVGGLDRIHRARGILGCYDFTATPFVPAGRRGSEEALFEWIVSDFGLNDAIEAGLVKTPRVVVRDDAVPDARTYKSKLYHLYNDDSVKSDFNRPALPHEPLPSLVMNAYYLLGIDWQAAAEQWQQDGRQVPPVMITVANRTETAARIKHSFDRRKILVERLCDPDRTLHIDSKELRKAEEADEPVALIDESGDEDEQDANAEAEESSEDEGENGAAPAGRKLTKKQRAELLRRQVDTVGRVGELGEQIQNVISVGMLSEGWDAKTVTHIMGLRAFTSQLLCEQVVGRGLRRTSYETHDVAGRKLFVPEYVNIFGVPFTFLPHEGGDDTPPPPPDPGDEVKVLPERAAEHEISWPHVVRIEHCYRTKLSLDVAQLPILELDAADCRQLAELAPTVDGKPDLARVTEIALEELGRRSRQQTLVFQAAADTFDLMHPQWHGPKDELLVQVIRLAEQVLKSGRIRVRPELFHQDPLRRRIVMTLKMTEIVQHFWGRIQEENTTELAPVFDTERPIRSTADMRPWTTRRPNELTRRSHVNRCVFDSTWEASEAFALDRADAVQSWVKNDHLGFEIVYVFRGVVGKYRPDYLIRLQGGRMLVLEVKGENDDKSRTKRKALAQWVEAVNAHGGLGRWSSDVSYSPGDVHDVLARWGG